MCQEAPEKIAGVAVIRPCYLEGELFYQLANGSLVAATAELAPDIDALGPGCYIGPNAKVGKYGKLGPFCRIETEAEMGPLNDWDCGVILRAGARTGERCRLDHGVTIDAYSALGNRNFIGPKVIIAIGNSRTLPNDFEYGSTQIGDYGHCLTVEIFEAMMALTP